MTQNRQGWHYLLDSGEILTAAQITGRYGLSVSEVYEDGSMRADWRRSSMDLPAIETMTYFTAIFWLGGFAVGLIIALILPQTH